MSRVPEFRKGDLLRARDLNALAELVLEVARGQLLPSADFKLVQLPDGAIPRVRRQAVTRVSHPFKITTADEDSGRVRVWFRFGTVDGVEPTIKGKPISEQDKDGELPSLLVEPDHFKKHGVQERALIYFRYTLDRASGRLAKVEPVASATRPDTQSWTYNRLVAVLIREDKESAAAVHPCIFFDQGFAVTDLKENGRFTPWPWARS